MRLSFIDLETFGFVQIAPLPDGQAGQRYAADGIALCSPRYPAEIPLWSSIFPGGFRTGHHDLPLRVARQSSGSAGQNGEARSGAVVEFAGREHYS